VKGALREDTMDTLKIEIHTRNWKSVSDSLQKHNLSIGDEIQISDQATLKYESVFVQKALDLPDIYTLWLLGIITDMGINLAANLIYDLVKGAKDDAQLVIETTIVEIEEGEIKRVIKQKVKAK
jgi:hypothetical protein